MESFGLVCIFRCSLVTWFLFLRMPVFFSTVDCGDADKMDWRAWRVSEEIGTVPFDDARTLPERRRRGARRVIAMIDGGIRRKREKRRREDGRKEIQKRG